MSRLVQAVDGSDPAEEVMLLGGERGLVALHLPGGHADVMVIHSPVERPGWSGPDRCTRLESWCWCMTTREVTSPETLGLVRLLVFCREDASTEENLWHAMRMAYKRYLEGRP